ncbi:MAG: PIG-L family deacetylase [Candidatus Thorarchaeota archaeon]|nr:PIG-L family deacetylase [Candidatus Thorarchaeota archaeon]
MRVRSKRALVLSPHTDDAVLGAGILLHRLSAQGCRVTYLAFTSCNDTLVGTEFPEGEIEREDRNALKLLGIDDVHYLEYKNKHLEAHRQEILDKMYTFRADNDMDLVIAPHAGDFHQDHQTIGREALRMSTRHGVTVLQYPVIGTSKDFNPNLFVPVSEEEARLKMRAISCYKTQFRLRKNWFDLDLFWSELKTNGVYIDTKYAEAFVQVKGTWILE